MNVLYQPLHPSPHPKRGQDQQRQAQSAAGPQGPPLDTGLSGSEEGLPSKPAPAAQGGYREAARAYADARGVVQLAPETRRDLRPDTASPPGRDGR